MPKLTRSVPKYRHHKRSGQAVVTLHGKDVYLGPYGSDASRAEYDRLIAEYLAGGRTAVPAPGPAEDGSSGEGLTVSELFLRYWEDHVVTYYRKHGEPTSEQDNLRKALSPLIELYGHIAANEFGPLALKTYRQRLIDLGHARTAINRDVDRVKRMFKWGGENEVVSPQLYQNLRCVSGLKRGRSAAVETKPIQPVPEKLVDGVIKHAPAPVAAMIELQRLTGMRPGEVVIMRRCDLDTSGRLWAYTPASHKTEHHDKRRVVYLGPQAKEVIEPWLKHDCEAYLFSPAGAEEQRRARQQKRRKTRASCGNKPGTNRCKRPRKSPSDRYTTDSYGQAIADTCDKAFPPPDSLARRRVPGRGRKSNSTRWETIAEWRNRLGEDKWAALLQWRREHRWSPNQLRHNAATYLRKQFGLEAARVVLGHGSAAVTEVYAELDLAKAADIMEKVG